MEALQGSKPSLGGEKMPLNIHRRPLKCPGCITSLSNLHTITFKGLPADTKFGITAFSELCLFSLPSISPEGIRFKELAEQEPSCGFSLAWLWVGESAKYYWNQVWLVLGWWSRGVQTSEQLIHQPKYWNQISALLTANNSFTNPKPTTSRKHACFLYAFLTRNKFLCYKTGLKLRECGPTQTTSHVEKRQLNRCVAFPWIDTMCGIVLPHLFCIQIPSMIMSVESSCFCCTHILVHTLDLTTIRLCLSPAVSHAFNCWNYQCELHLHKQQRHAKLSGEGSTKLSAKMFDMNPFGNKKVPIPEYNLI